MYKKGVPKKFAKFAKFTGKHLYLNTKEIPPQVFSGKFYVVSENTYFVEHLRTVASGHTTFFCFNLTSNLCLFTFYNDISVDVSFVSF